MSFFSESRLNSLSKLLGHDKLPRLIDEIDGSIRKKMHYSQDAQAMVDASGKDYSLPELSSPIVEAYMTGLSSLGGGLIRLLTRFLAYFEEMHPLYPFIHRETFCSIAFGPRVRERLFADPAWCALYHAVLTLGCVCVEGDAFRPTEGKEWQFFRICLSRLSQLLLRQRTLAAVQVRQVPLLSRSALTFPGAHTDGEFSTSECSQTPHLLIYLTGPLRLVLCRSAAGRPMHDGGESSRSCGGP